MSGWISSKLKVAENLLQQIDNQAAESLRKNEGSRSGDLRNDAPRKSFETLPLKDQLRKKKSETNHVLGKLRNDNSSETRTSNDSNREPNKQFGNPKSSLTDSDWTELLSAPPPKKPGNDINGVMGLRRDGKRQDRYGSNLSAFGRKRSQSIGSKSSEKLDASSVNGRHSESRGSNGEDIRISESSQSSAEMKTDGRLLLGEGVTGMVEVDENNVAKVEQNNELHSPGDINLSHSRARSPNNDSALKDENHLQLMLPDAVSELSELKTELASEQDGLSSGMVPIKETDAYPISSVSGRRGYPSVSDGRSDSDTDSDSTSSSESEREREERRRRREQILAEKAAVKAIEAIKERENLVARLEGEKQSLEKILEERAKQQAQEASELQMTMMEIMEAVDLEKQKHNNTRMEAFAILAKLETANADLARSLASAQWNLGVEVNKVAELRQQIDLKEATHEELRWKARNSNPHGKNLTALKGVEFEHEILEAEYSSISDKVERLQEKAKRLETSIEMTRKELESPTEVEVELKRRLEQLTDHLIQKQAQVEALSSEKATLAFRIETVSRLLEENKSLLNIPDDLESGIWELSHSRLKPMFQERLRSGQKHIGSMLRQLDSIFSTGYGFLKRNPTARIYSVIYLVCLHIWVLYIVMSHSRVPEEASSAAVISLENINNTGNA